MGRQDQPKGQGVNGDALPAHKCGLYLTHNANRDIYQSAECYIGDKEDSGAPDWASEDSRARCIATGEVWELQWYPNTPIGFCEIWGATLEEVLEAARRAS